MVDWSQNVPWSDMAIVYFLVTIIFSVCAVLVQLVRLWRITRHQWSMSKQWGRYLSMSLLIVSFVHVHVRGEGGVRPKFIQVGMMFIHVAEIKNSMSLCVFVSVWEREEGEVHAQRKENKTLFADFSLLSLNIHNLSFRSCICSIWTSSEETSNRERWLDIVLPLSSNSCFLYSFFILQCYPLPFLSWSGLYLLFLVDIF